MFREFFPTRLRWLTLTGGGLVTVAAFWLSSPLPQSPWPGSPPPVASIGEGALTRPDRNLPATVASPQSRSLSRVVKSQPLKDQPMTAAGVSAAGLGTPQELVMSLTTLDWSGGPLTQEIVSRWQEGFERLVQQGPAALPAIRSFWGTFTDFSFGLTGLQKLGYATARTAMIGAVAQIGGPEALALSLEMMRLTAEPPEIALLAANLELLAPDQPGWRAEALQAARESLTLAAAGPPKDQDVAPLFEVLNRYGGASAVPDIEEATRHWNYYAPMALAQLPDSAGVPSLIRMAQEQNGPIAFQLLTQLAGANPEARRALLDLAGAKMIPPSAWPHLQPLLQGHQFHFSDSVFDESGDTASLDGMKMVHVAKGNQNYYLTTDATRLSKKHLDQQTALVDALAAVVADPDATKVLDGAKTALDAARAAIDSDHSKSLRLVR